MNDSADALKRTQSHPIEHRRPSSTIQNSTFKIQNSKSPTHLGAKLAPTWLGGGNPLGESPFIKVQLFPVFFKRFVAPCTTFCKFLESFADFAPFRNFSKNDPHFQPKNDDSTPLSRSTSQLFHVTSTPISPLPIQPILTISAILFIRLIIYCLSQLIIRISNIFYPWLYQSPIVKLGQEGNLGRPKSDGFG